MSFGDIGRALVVLGLVATPVGLVWASGNQTAVLLTWTGIYAFVIGLVMILLHHGGGTHTQSQDDRWRKRPQ